MKKLLKILSFVAVIAVVFAACSKKDSFHIAGSIEGVGSQNLRAIFYADGAVRSVPASVIDGKFSLKGSTPSPSVVSFYLSDRTLVGRAVVKNGDDIEVKFVKDDPFAATISGSDINVALSDFYKANKKVLSTGSHQDINRLVADYVKAHPDDQLSSVLVTTLYDADIDPQGAVKTFNLIAPEARLSDLADGWAEMTDFVAAKAKEQRVMPIKYYPEKGDSLKTFKPSTSPLTLLAITLSDLSRDSVVKELRELSKRVSPRRFEILEISADNDQATWRHAVKRDSAEWTRGWLPGALASQGIDILNVTDVPFFIVVDSAGRQLARTRSISDASSLVKSHLK